MLPLILFYFLQISRLNNEHTSKETTVVFKHYLYILLKTAINYPITCYKLLKPRHKIEFARPEAPICTWEYISYGRGPSF